VIYQPHIREALLVRGLIQLDREETNALVAGHLFQKALAPDFF
jgi:hypothetical protein